MHLYSIGGVVNRIAAFLRIDLSVLANQLLRIAGVWVLAWAAMWLVRLIARRIEHAVDDGDDSVVTLREKRGRTISQLLESVGRVVILTLGVLLTLNVFIDMGTVLAGLAGAGLGIAFAAQSFLKDVMAGFFFLVEDQFGVGDIIEVAGKGGVVERMTLRIVVLRDVEGTMHVVPNSQITTVSNRTRLWARAVLDFGVAYSADVDRALEVMRDESAKFSEDPEWKVQLDGALEVWGVNSLDDSAVVIRVVARSQPGSQWSVAREFRRRVKNRLDAEGIEIPFPQRTVHFRLDDQQLRASLPTAAAGSAPAIAPAEGNPR